MFKEKFEELYEEVFAPKLLPMDLLENLNDKNYLEVNFHKEKELTIAFTKCKLPSGDITQFKYTFIENKLYKLEQILNFNDSVLLYDRDKEISNKMKELQKLSYTSAS